MSGITVARRCALVLGAGLFAATFALGVAQSWRQRGVLPSFLEDPLSDGRRLIESGDIKAAVAQLRMFALMEPGQSDGWVRLGQALALTGDRDGAIAAFERSLQVLPISTLAVEQLAMLYLEAGRVEDARRQASTLFEAGLELPPQLRQLVTSTAETAR